MFTAAGATTYTFLSTKIYSFKFNPPFVGRRSNLSSAKKRDDVDSTQQQQQQSSLFNLKFSPTLFIQSAISLFGLGFVDAGYSGDWSRIGAISKETEELLKMWAFVVAPLCIFLVYSLSAKEKDKSD